VKILIVHNAPIPVYAYGGTERVIWDLGKSLVSLGHCVSYLVPTGSQCSFATIIPIQPHLSWDAQIPPGVDVVHFQINPRTELSTPYLVTEHGNANIPEQLPCNTVFLSRNHAERYGATEFVYNGLDWASYGPVDFERERERYHFLGKAQWRVKNVAGAIEVAKRAGIELNVLGGDRLNVKRGFRWTLSRKIHFHGMVGGLQKTQLLNASCGLIFPVRWHEPFGLAVIESMYFGCPVFSTPYGALPELVPAHCGVLSNSADMLAHAVRETSFDARECHTHAVSQFSAERMARGYLRMYERVCAGEKLHAQPPMMQGAARELAWHE
jgi:glycosyltransferase involved in cell wall biosynthesis